MAQRHALLCALLLLAALFVRALVPTGFMPTAGAQGLTISMCTGQGAVEVRADRLLPEHEPTTKACDFALGLGGAPLPMDVPTFAAPVMAFALASPITLRIWRDIAALAAPPPPSQGPPLTD